jgi:hypothetical protein
LLSSHVLVHAGEPRIHFIAQQTLAKFVDVLGPFLNLQTLTILTSFVKTTYTNFFGFNVRNTMAVEVLNALSDPAYSILYAGRDVSVRLVRSDRHEHIGEVLHREAQIGSGSFNPFVK